MLTIATSFKLKFMVFNWWYGHCQGSVATLGLGSERTSKLAALVSSLESKRAGSRSMYWGPTDMRSVASAVWSG